MTSVYYEEIHSLFRGTVSDCKFIELDQFENMEVMQELLHKALAGGYVRKQFATLKLDDDSQTLKFELRNTIDEDADKDFFLNMTANYMVYEWSKSQVYKIENTMQFVGGAEQKFYSQANHLDELIKLKETSLNDAQNYISEHNFVFNSYLDGGKR